MANERKGKKLSLLVCVGMLCVALVGGTFAYLTDRESAKNEFDLANVGITLNEDFTQNSELFPGKDVEKVVSVTNNDADAYVWLEIAIPAALDDAGALKSDFKNASGWSLVGEPAQELINDLEYNVYTVKYNEILVEDAQTTDAMTKIALDSSIDIDPDGNLNFVKFGKVTDAQWNIQTDPLVYVDAFAIQAEGFDNFEDAYDAYQAQWNEMPWDGTADTSWYNDTDTEFELTTAEQLAGLAQLVDGGNNFAGKTIKLGKNIDLYAESENGERVSFDPIGDKLAFAGTFDGQDYTISNLNQSGWDFGYEWGKYGALGLFGKLKSATVKNLTIEGAECFVEGGDIGGIAGSATGECVFENITINDSVFATYNNGLGGIIGCSGAGTYTFKNITLAEDVVLAGLWGSFDSSIGGIVGQGEPGATYNFEDVNIACRLDVYNDCTASYDHYNYRMCGMVIGRLAETTTIDGSNYPDTSQYNITCSNVTVTYGEWANYHYCDPTPGYNNGRGMRVEPGYSYDGLPANYDHSQCTTHHNELIPFDQVFGGDQLGVKGLKTYEGVKVVYNNK